MYRQDADILCTRMLKRLHGIHCDKQALCSVHHAILANQMHMCHMGRTSRTAEADFFAASLVLSFEVDFSNSPTQMSLLEKPINMKGR